MKRSIIFLIIFSLALTLSPVSAQSSEESHVIGRISGTYQPLPGYFLNNTRLAARGIYNVEFYGFRLIRETDGKTYIIRPTHEGYFHQELPAGIYTLSRKRNDRPDHRQPKVLDIMTINVDPGMLINLGTIDLVFKGEPVARVRHFQKVVKGTFIYRYGYERSSADRAFRSPLEWFSGKKPDLVAVYGDRTMNVQTAPTGEQDSSRVRLRESYRIDD